MKSIYIEPKTWILNLDNECALCAATPVGGQISGSGFENIETVPAEESPGTDVPMTAKGGDFFEETISPGSSSLWGDDE